MAVTRATLRLVQQLRARVDTLTDAQARAMTAAWTQAWIDVAADLHAALLDLTSNARNGRVSRTAWYKSQRLTAALRAIGERLDQLAAHADTTIVAGLRDAVDDAARAQAGIVESQLPAGTYTAQAVFARVNTDALDRIVHRSTQRIHSETRPLARDSERAMKRELIRGVAVGDNPRAVARRILRRAEGRFNGGLTRALAISRTEMLSAHREATRLGWQQHTGVLKGWLWICELSTRSCPACIALHGSFHPLDEPGPDDHVNGRCVASAVTRPWKDLGFSIPEPDSALTDGRVWFDALPDSDQLAIMGPQRLALLRSGGAQWNDLAVRQHNPGWRDSFQVRPVRDLGKRAAG